MNKPLEEGLNKLFQRYHSNKEIIAFLQAHYLDSEFHETLMESIYWPNLFAPSLLRRYDRHLLITMVNFLFNAGIKVRLILAVLRYERMPNSIRAVFWYLIRMSPAIYGNDDELIDNPHRRLEWYLNHSKDSSLWAQLWLYTNEHVNLFYERTPAALREAVMKDSVALFDMQMMLYRKSLTTMLLLGLIQRKAMKIFSYVLSNNMISHQVAPMDGLFLYICAKSPIETAPEMARCMAEKQPELVNQTDLFLNNPLWYLFWRERENWTGKLADTLINLGCNPNQKNHLNLSYEQVIRSLNDVPYWT